MVVFYTFSVVVVVVVVVGGEGEDAGKREGGEAVGEAVGCGRRGVGDGGEGVDVGERGGVVTVGEAVRGGGEKLMEWRQEARERVVLTEGRWSAGWLL